MQNKLLLIIVVLSIFVAGVGFGAVAHDTLSSDEPEMIEIQPADVDRPGVIDANDVRQTDSEGTDDGS